MIDVMALIVPMVVMLALSGTISCVFSKKIGVCIPLAYMLVGFIMFFTQLAFHTFDIGIIIVCIGAFLFIPAAIKKKEEIKENLLTYGLLAFLIAYMMYCCVDFRRTFAAWDEMSHWGVMVKEMLRLDTWYCVPDSRLNIHKDYPPFVSLIELFWCRLSGGMTETGCYMALHTFSISLLLPPVIDTCCKKQVVVSLKNLFMLALLNISVLMFMETFDDSNEFMSIYKDLVLSFIFVYLMLRLLLSERDNFLKIAVTISSAALLVTKQLGILFIMLVFLFILADYVFCKEKKPLWIFSAEYVSLGVFASIPFILWSRLVKSYDLSGQFDMRKISPDRIREIVLDTNAVSVQRQVLNKFIRAVFASEISTWYLPISYFALTLVMIIVFAVIRKKNKAVSNERLTALFVTFLCGSVACVMVLGILYLFCFSEGEAMALASFGRYTSGYIMAEMLILAGIIGVSIFFSGKFGLKKIVLVSLGIVIFTNVSNLRIFLPGMLKTALIGNAHQEYADIAEDLENKVDGSAEIYILAKDNIQSQYYVNYYSYDLRYIMDYNKYFESDITDEMASQMLDNLKKCDYLYLKDSNNGVFSVIEKYFDSDELQERVLYHRVGDRLERV